MSPRQIDVHPEAVAEARAAAQWYRETNPQKAKDLFLDHIRGQISAVLRTALTMVAIGIDNRSEYGTV